jgi:uncharacterized LabA/DUF88 family protein
MADVTYVYIDGESHFHRSEAAWRKIHGKETCLDSLRCSGQTDEGLVLVDAKAKVFWTRKMNPGAERTYYFTAISGDETAHHEIQKKLRAFDLDSHVVLERKALWDQRKNLRVTQQLIEKAKGVDIALAVQMLEEAQDERFQVCHLYTSDIDFLPVIEAVRARVRRVYVHGYLDGLGERSPFHHACDQFIDLEEMLRNECEMDEQIRRE